MSWVQNRVRKSTAFCSTRSTFTPVRNDEIRVAFNSSRLDPPVTYRTAEGSIRIIRAAKARLPKANFRNATKLSRRVKVPSKSKTDSTCAPEGPDQAYPESSRSLCKPHGLHEGDICLFHVVPPRPLYDFGRPVVMSRWFAHRIVLLEYSRSCLIQNELRAIQVLDAHSKAFLNNADL